MARFSPRSWPTEMPIAWEGERLSIMSLAGLRILKWLRGFAQDVADLEALGPES
jgi:hypothetical protein